ncbi:uncharacterized protein LOC143647711 [Tamandua tetradactyla]|uniref:uncharacterized protein LOC143647711 n=1 Tax=Tamandua tetradactyla TaxID=48850 RepID=UPI004053C932
MYSGHLDLQLRSLRQIRQPIGPEREGQRPISGRVRHRKSVPPRQQVSRRWSPPLIAGEPLSRARRPRTENSPGVRRGRTECALSSVFPGFLTKQIFLLCGASLRIQDDRSLEIAPMEVGKGEGGLRLRALGRGIRKSIGAVVTAATRWRGVLAPWSSYTSRLYSEKFQAYNKVERFLEWFQREGGGGRDIWHGLKTFLVVNSWRSAAGIWCERNDKRTPNTEGQDKEHSRQRKQVVQRPQD